MKRLLCIVTEMGAGGAETFLMKIYRKIDKEKYQMDFCVSVEKKGYYDDEILQNGGRIFHITPKSKSIISFKEELYKVISENGYQNVLKITSNAMGFLDLKVAKKAGAKLCAARSSNSNDPAGIKPKVAHRLGKLLYEKYVDVKIAPSDLAAIYTFGEQAYKNGEVKILHNALDLDEYKFDLEERRRIREEFGIKNSEILCGNVGRFSAQKNHEFLIDVFSELSKNHSNYKLLLVGKGELESKIKDKCAEKDLLDKVIFAGIRSDIPAILSAMDVFVFPSLYEGMPNTVIEAQSCGLPCIVSDTITKEANICGHVTFLPISKTDCWTESIIHTEMYRRTQKGLDGYDIKTIANQFIELLK